MKKLSMIKQVSITFEEGCDMYILNCKQRNLRQGTINHYKQSYTQFYKYFDREMLLSEIAEQTYKDYVVYLCGQIDNDKGFIEIFTLSSLNRNGGVFCFIAYQQRDSVW